LSGEGKPCLVSCSALKEEIMRLVKQGDLDVELVLVSKYFHIEPTLLEKNLRRVVEKSLSRFPGRVILVYGDLCLGPNNEMKKLVEEYGVVKVDALNCTDCLLGGKGKFLEADPNHQFLFLHPGMIGFFNDLKKKAQQENVNEDTFKEKFFSGLKGIVLLDTLGEAKTNKEVIEKLHTGLIILETRETGLENLKQVILEAIKRNSRARKKPEHLPLISLY
jgi:hypothetical protein